MIIALSIDLVVGCGLLLSVLAFGLNARHVSAGRSALALLVFCLGAAVFQWLRLGTLSVGASIVMWLGFVFLPCAAVFAMSRIPAMRVKPWLLLLVGPLTYFVAIFAGLTLINGIASAISG